ncbi:TolB family protein [Streptomyces sp. CB02923]|uniref:TolB family protein n=1 Tax=Streptomyces sp. CB02923 TaxID=1718985 RepID=UPI000A99D4B2|nr:PD40 domain-containing protein [Streptomyces sp. CB02923]
MRRSGAGRGAVRVVGLLAGACVVAGVLPAAAVAANPAAPATERVSVAADGTQGNGFSGDPKLSANGRFVAFSSEATNLGPADTNGHQDVYVKDLRTGKVDLVSVGSDGTLGDGLSGSPEISADGRYVAFYSGAANLVPGDTNGEGDVFVHDRRTGRTVSPTAGPGKSPYGYGVQNFAISGDGQRLAFGSYRPDLVPGDTNERLDIFVHDVQKGTTRRVSVAGDGTQTDAASAFPSISADGRRVAFTSKATNLTPAGPGLRRPPPQDPMYVHDLATGRTRAASLSTTDAVVGVSPFPRLSPDGRYAVFSAVAADVVPGDTNGTYDLFARDLEQGTTRLLSRAHDGSQGDGWSSDGRLSADNRRLFFTSAAANLVPGDTNGQVDGFVRDLRTGRVERINVGADGGQSASWTNIAAPDATGQLAAFDSRDDGLVPGDTNGTGDVFVRRLQH